MKIVANKTNNFSTEELKVLLSESGSLWDFCKKLGYKNKSSGVYRTVKKYLTEKNIDLKEFPILYNRIGLTKQKNSKEVFSENSSYDRKDMKRRILKEKLLDYKCSSCGISEWMGNPLSLQLDHINGINNDNRIENLRFLCPNCHTQTPTWGTKKRA